MKGKEVGIVIVVGTALVIIECGADGGDDVIAVELSIRVLEPMFRRVLVIEEDAAGFPLPQIIGVDECQRIADGCRGAHRVTLGDDVGERPIAGACRVFADLEFRGTTGERNEAGGGIEGGNFAIGADLDDRGHVGEIGDRDAEDIDHFSVWSGDGISFQPCGKSAVEPRGVAGEGVGDCPAFRVEQVGVGRGGNHAGPVAFAPFVAGVGVLEAAPDAAGVFQHRHGSGVPLAIGDDGGIGPCVAVVGGAADDKAAVVFVGAEGEQFAVVGEEAGPVIAVDIQFVGPRFALVGRAVEAALAQFVFGASRAEKIVGREVIAIRCDADGWRTDVVPGRSGRVMDDDAGWGGVERECEEGEEEERFHIGKEGDGGWRRVKRGTLEMVGG